MRVVRLLNEDLGHMRQFQENQGKVMGGGDRMGAYQRYYIGMTWKLRKKPKVSRSTSISGTVLWRSCHDRAQVAGKLAADTLRIAHKTQNRGQGVTKAQYVEATMKPRENGSENRFLSRVRSAAKREREP